MRDQAGKARFEHIYDEPEPGAYFRVLGGLDYQAPRHTVHVIRELIDARRKRTGTDDVVVLDLCCSYGLNAAVVNHDVDWDELVARYSAEDRCGRPTQALVEEDREFFRGRRRTDAARFIGLDVAANAVAYAQEVGFVDRAFTVDLEHEHARDGLRSALSSVDIIVCTGGVGYVTDRTFARVLQWAPKDPPAWVAALVLRWIDYDGIRDVLAENGLRTEVDSSRNYRQRAFADGSERDSVLSRLRDHAIEPSRGELSGYHEARLFVSRPKREVDEDPLDRVLSSLIDLR